METSSLGGILGRINKIVNVTINISTGEFKTMGTELLIEFDILSVTVKIAD